MTATLTTERDFLDAIIAAPGEDTPRLVFADWLEEHGQAERAEFIRVQVEMWKEMHAKHADRCNCRGCKLRRRQKELGWNRSAAASGLPLPFASLQTTTYVFRRGFVAEISCNLADWLRHGPEIVRCQPVEAVRVRDREPQNAGHGVSLWYRKTPPASRRPQHYIPGAVFDFLPGRIGGRDYVLLYDSPEADSPEAAHAALSTAALLWAKNAAGAAG